MIPESLSWLFDADLALTVWISAFALAAVWIPFYRGVKLCLRARSATRLVERADLRRASGRGGDRVESVALLMVRVMRKSLQESDGESYPAEFMIDAAKQYVTNEYDAHYSRPISMLANILPPIGFIGTTTGLLILFLSMHLANDSLELAALAAALTSSIFALIGFAVLEAWKIRLYGRLLACLDQVLAMAEEAKPAPPRARAAAR
jgi:biopolymer transport protein ExbB/TolQ